MTADPSSSPSLLPVVAENSATASRAWDRAMARQVVVCRLLALDEAGTLQTVHVRIAAQSVGVNVRTVWRWLAVAKETGRIEPARRRGVFTLTDSLWARLGELGGNVKALHRWMAEHADDVLPALDRDRLPSLSTLHHAVTRERRAGRVLDLPRPGYARMDPDRYDRALAELALPGTIDELGQAQPAVADPAPKDGADRADTPSMSVFTEGVRLYVPGAHVVATRQVGEVTEAIAHTSAARGVLCVYGDPGHGKTVAVDQALRLLPRRVPVRHAVVSVKPALPQLRAALLTAFGLPATSLTNRTDTADRALIDALKTPGVLVIDDVQRIAAPELDYLGLLVDAPTTQTSLVLCGAGAERALARAPALASRVLTWQQCPAWTPARSPPCCACSTRCGTPRQTLTCCTPMPPGRRGTSVPGRRSLPTCTRQPETTVDRTVLTRTCSRLGPTP